MGRAADNEKKRSRKGVLRFKKDEIRVGRSLLKNCMRFLRLRRINIAIQLMGLEAITRSIEVTSRRYWLSEAI